MVTRFSVFVLLTSSFVLSSFLAPAPASAQPPQARAEGRVVDAQQRAVPRAVVVFTSLVGAPQSITTNEDGHFAVVGLAEGRYDVTASAPGLFGESRGVTLTANQLTTIDVTLHLSAITEALVVSAAHTDLPLSRAADSVTVISGAEIESRQLTSVGDALAGLPGFTVAHSGGPGTLTSVFPRGGESDYTLVLVDGVRANAFGGGLDLSQVQLTDVERVEVVRGPQSALFGSDAIGGVVQVITRQGGPPSVTGKIETGSRDTRRAAVATSGERSSWKWNGGADYFSEDGFTDAAPANGELVSNDDAREAQVWVGGGRRFTRGTDVGGSLRYLETERGAPGPYGSDPAGRFFGVDQISRGDTARRSVGFRAMHPWFGPASRIRQRVEIDHADYDLTFLSSFDPDNPSESETRRVHARVQTDAVLDAGFSVSGGFEWLGERAGSSFITAGTEEVPVKRSVLGFFGEGRWNGVERIALQAGVRGERITRNVLPGNDALSDADTVLSVNPKVAVSYLVSSSLPSEGAGAWTRLRASAGTGIRPPDAFEIAFTNNPALKPERSRSFDAGVTQALVGGRVQLDGTAFFNDYDDLIISVGSLRDVSRYRSDNISNARARGLELAGSVQGSRALHVRVSYTFLDTEIREVDGLDAQAPPPYRVGDALLRRPRHQAAIDSTWTHRRATLFASIRLRGATLDAEPAFGPSGGLYENPGYQTIDVGGSFRVARSIDAFARILNASNRGYEEVLGYPAPRRSMFVGVRIAAGR